MENIKAANLLTYLSFRERNWKISTQQRVEDWASAFIFQVNEKFGNLKTTTQDGSHRLQLNLCCKLLQSTPIQGATIEKHGKRFPKNIFFGCLLCNQSYLGCGGYSMGGGSLNYCPSQLLTIKKFFITN